MPRGTKQQTSILHARQFLHRKSGSDNENEPPSSDQTPAHPPSRKKKTLAAQISEKDERITDLEATIAELTSSLQQLRNDFHALQEDHSALVTKNATTSLAHRSLNTLKRKADAAFLEEVRQKQKRIRRLENDRDRRADSSSNEIENLESRLDEKSQLLVRLEHQLTTSREDIHSRDITILSLQSDLKRKQSILTATRQTVYAIRKKSDRAKSALKESRRAQLQRWHPTKNGQYIAAARALARDLTEAGCSSGKIAFAVESCARAFGIEIQRAFISARTVGRVIDEGGKYGEIQLAREILNAPGKIISV
jgi:DNA repair exonuclease SbcCD ATPase subunit